MIDRAKIITRLDLSDYEGQEVGEKIWTEFENELKDILDEIESEVNDAMKLLEDINSVCDLSMVDNCLNKLQALSHALY